jgi:hypothetical protein
MAGRDQKRELRFASVERFEQWKAGLKPAEVEKYADYEVSQLKDGSVLVYKDINKNKQFDDDVDKVIAYKGLSIHKSKADDREGYSKYRVSHHSKGDTHKKYKSGEGAKPISAFSLITKILGGAGKTSQLAFDRSAYTTASTGLWRDMKRGVLNQFVACSPKFSQAMAEAQAIDDVAGNTKATDRFSSKMTSSPRFKIAVLALLSQLQPATLVGWLTNGHGAVPELTKEGAQSILEDPGSNFSEAVSRIVGKYPTITQEGLEGAVGIDIEDE